MDMNGQLQAQLFYSQGKNPPASVNWRIGGLKNQSELFRENFLFQAMIHPFLKP